MAEERLGFRDSEMAKAISHQLFRHGHCLQVTNSGASYWTGGLPLYKQGDLEEYREETYALYKSDPEAFDRFYNEVLINSFAEYDQIILETRSRYERESMISEIPDAVKKGSSRL